MSLNNFCCTQSSCTMYKSFVLAINTLLVFDMHLRNGALFLSIKFLLYPSMVFYFLSEE